VPDFCLFVNWLYSQRITLPLWPEYEALDAYSVAAATTNTAGEIPEESGQALGIRQKRNQRMHDSLVDLYIFSDRRNVPELGNLIITTLINDRENCKPVASTPRRVNHAFSNLPAKLSLCRFLMDETTFSWDPDDIPEGAPLPAEFSRGLVQRMVKFRQDGKFTWRERPCETYHTHETEAARDACYKRHGQTFAKLAKKSTPK
jgi:hypothetical protein